MYPLEHMPHYLQSARISRSRTEEITTPYPSAHSTELPLDQLKETHREVAWAGDGEASRFGRDWHLDGFVLTLLQMGLKPRAPDGPQSNQLSAFREGKVALLRGAPVTVWGD